MKSRVTAFKFLLFSCTFCVVSGVCSAADRIKVASVGFVEQTIQKSNGAVEIKNNAGKTVTLSNNPTSTAIDTSSKAVTTVGWTDSNRTSKVKAVDNNNTTLVDMWIE